VGLGVARIGFPRGLQFIFGIAGVAYGLLGASFATLAIDPPPETRPEDEGVVRTLCAVLACGGIGVVIGSVRYVRARMYLHDGRLLIKSTWRVRTVPLAQVQNFAVGGTTGAIPIIPFACLAVVLTDGNALLLKDSKTFSRRRAASAADEANRLLATDAGTGQGSI